ncbi:MAG: hypothetical protein FRX49_13629 [Trebouxia sp. A1-2]|nr:MAG: hypothetical protein FRX49_13629 [Trebouxia sp. A1-2]
MKYITFANLGIGVGPPQGLPDWEVHYLGEGQGVMLAATQLSDSMGLEIGSHMSLLGVPNQSSQETNSHARSKPKDTSGISVADLELAVGFLASLALEAGASVVCFADLTIGVEE